MKAPPPAQTFQQRWSAWGGSFGGSNTTNGNAAVGSNTVTARDYGFAAGMDYHYLARHRGGLCARRRRHQLGPGARPRRRPQRCVPGRRLRHDAGRAGLCRRGARLHQSLDEHQRASRSAISSTRGSMRRATAAASRPVIATPHCRQIGVTPYAALQAQSFHTPRYSETDLTGGGFGLTYNAMSATDTRSELGSRFDDMTMVNGMPLSLRARAAWAHDWVTNPALDAVFQALPGASFIVNGATPPKNSALASAGAELHMTANWSLAAKFDGEFAAGSQTYAGTGTLRYTW